MRVIAVNYLKNIVSGQPNFRDNFPSKATAHTNIVIAGLTRNPRLNDVDSDFHQNDDERVIAFFPVKK
ncbi:MAG: hypothetical protein NTZ13_00105 [Candidatus Parcubacteria bacterium]|nr:hypothetical protein [Candidatus Parcubacteria bacterium]